MSEAQSGDATDQDGRAADVAVARDVPDIVVTPDGAGRPEVSSPPEVPSPIARPNNTPPPRAQQVDGTQGVTGRGVIVLIMVVTALGGLADLAVSGHRGHVFGVAFAASATVGAFVVRRRDLATAMIAPPLVYCVAIFLMSLVDQGDLSGGLLTREAFYLGNAFVTGAPAIWAGTALAAGITWYRGKPGRR